MDYDVGNIFCKKQSSFIFSLTSLTLSFVGLMFIQMWSFSPTIKIFSSLLSLVVIVLLTLTLGRVGSIVAGTFNALQIVFYIYVCVTAKSSTYLNLLAIAIVSLLLLVALKIFTYRVSEKMKLLRIKIDEEHVDVGSRCEQ